MAIRGRLITLGAAALVALVSYPSGAFAQDIPNPDLKNISPAYEGWEKNPDGSYYLYYGYFSRNAEEVTIPLGPNNTLSPAPEDRGQPTNFLPGRGRNAFRIKVPPGWNEKIVWTLTIAGQTQTANGTVQDLYEIAVDEDTRGNTAPTVKSGGNLTATVGQPVTLTGSTTDDGKPFRQGKPRLLLNWSKYRGPAAKIEFSKNDIVMPDGGGQGSTTATFKAPGVYTVRITATDTNLSVDDFITVTVK